MDRSYNGWTASRNPADFGGLTKLVVAGEEFAPGVRSGDVATVFQYFWTQFNKRVEPLVKEDWHQADDWGFNYRPNVNNPTQLSCHASATATDGNATRHPNGKRGTFTAPQVREIRQICAELKNVVRWGGDFPTADEMHVEICDNEAAVRAAANWVRGVASKGAPALTSSPFLEYGMQGEAVKELQRVLNCWYPSLTPLVEDGDFGAATKARVEYFQKAAGLTVDGIVGPATRKGLGL